MAVDMFLKLEGPDIEGESQDRAHSREIDVLAWSWGGSNSGSLHTGPGGGAAGRASFQDLSITKYVDSSTVDLIKLLATGERVTRATLTVRKAGQSPVEYILVELKPVIVTSVSTGGSGGEDRLTENVTLNFGQFKFSYTEQKPDGSVEKPEFFAWDIQRNSAGGEPF